MSVCEHAACCMQPASALSGRDRVKASWHVETNGTAERAETAASLQVHRLHAWEEQHGSSSIPGGACPLCVRLLQAHLMLNGAHYHVPLLCHAHPAAAGDLPGLSPSGFCSYACIAHGLQVVSKGRQGAAAANTVEVRTAIVRLPSKGSELLLTLNSPVTISPESQAAQHAGAGTKRTHERSPALLRAMLRTLQVHDWGLFG